MPFKQPFEQPLDAETMRIVIQLRRVLQQDHGVEIDLEDPHVMENLFDAAREARDKKAEKLAYTLCDHLSALHYRVAGPDCRQRLDDNFRRPLHEKFVGSNPGQVYRGQAVDQGRPPQATRELDSSVEPKREMVYRGSRVVV